MNTEEINENETVTFMDGDYIVRQAVQMLPDINCWEHEFKVAVPEPPNIEIITDYHSMPKTIPMRKDYYVTFLKRRNHRTGEMRWDLVSILK